MKKMQAFLKPLIAKLIGQYLNILVLLKPKWAAQKAFFIFCKVRKGRVAPHQRQYLEAAKHSKEKVAGHEIQIYRWPGTGPVVLLLHGWESNTFRWRNLIQHLQEANFEVIAFDAPAHGFSDGKYLHIPLYTQCVEYLVHQHEPKHIIGHSMGGMTALYHAHRHAQDTVEKIVTLGSPSEFKDIMNEFQRILNFNNRVLRALDTFIFEEFGFHVHEFSSRRFIENRSQKGLLFHDTSDKIIPFHASQKLHSVWKDSVLIPTDGLGHSLNHSSVNQQIVNFLLKA